MRVCVVGGGGREHALAMALGRTSEVVVTPGNPGMGPYAVKLGTGGQAGPVARWSGDASGSSVTCTTAPPEEVEADLVVIGPEQPLVDGLADRLRALGRRVVGPGADGARLEGSKAWMKEVLAAAGVPTAGYAVFSEPGPALAHLRAQEPPYVVKTDGLAAGKGVLVTTSLEQAEADVVAKLSGAAFGDAGRRVVLEEALAGPELSVMALCDGRRAVPLAPARDYKRLGPGHAGPNTGGMGAFSPVPGVGPGEMGRIMDAAVEPLVAELRRRGIDYRGVLYTGLMLTPDGPRVVEFNARLGDPETQVVLPRLDGEVDLAELLVEVAEGRMVGTARFRDSACVTVVLAAEGYPSAPRTGDAIAGLEEASRVEGVMVLHAGTARAGDGRLVTAGGRVLDVCALGTTLAEARQRAYRAVACLSWPGMQCRADIAEAPR